MEIIREKEQTASRLVGKCFRGALGYVTGIALDENDEIIGYKYVNFGKMMDFIKAGDDANTALEKAKGQYGRVADAVRCIDPRHE